MDLLTKYTPEQEKAFNIKLVDHLFDLGCLDLAQEIIEHENLLEDYDFMNSDINYLHEQLEKAREEKYHQERRIEMFKKLITNYEEKNGELN